MNLDELTEVMISIEEVVLQPGVTGGHFLSVYRAALPGSHSVDDSD